MGFRQQSRHQRIQGFSIDLSTHHKTPGHETNKLLNDELKIKSIDLLQT